MDTVQTSETICPKNNGAANVSFITCLITCASFPLYHMQSGVPTSQAFVVTGVIQPGHRYYSFGYKVLAAITISIYIF